MQIAKWGNSLAVRIPADVARALNLNEVDEVELHAGGSANTLEVRRSAELTQAREALRSLRGLFPADYRFDRDEANAR